MKRKQILLAALAVILVLSATVGPALAYFTTHVTAEGQDTMIFENKTEIHENVIDGVKYVTITNTGESPVYVRARAYAPSDIEPSYSGDGWTIGDGGYYYTHTVLEPGDSTNELVVSVQAFPGDAEAGDSFNLIVIYEAVPATYDEDGNPVENWDVDLTEGGQG